MAIQYKEGSFPSADGKNTVVYSNWTSDAAKPKAVLQLVHGMAEYINRYDEFAQFMAENGYSVYGHDHLGHGRTAGTNADHGYFAEKDGYKLLVEDVHKMTVLAHAENPGLPYILLGHSMGSMLVRLYADTYSGDIDGLIIMGTSGPNPATGAGKLLAKLIGVFKGKKHQSAFVNQIGFGAFTKGIADAQTPFDWLSKNADSVRAYIEDEKCGFLFTTAGYVDLFSLLGDISKPAWGDGIRKDLPIQLISGKDDPVGGYGKGVSAVYAQLEDKGITDLELILYDNLRHEILNEPERAGVYNDLLQWCDRIVTQTN